MLVRRATTSDLGLLTPLFDDYRQFYRKPSNMVLSRSYLADRLGREESIVFLATDGVRGLGFTQLYPSFDSLAARPLFILYDLFVAPDARKTGVGRALMDAARAHAEAHGASKVILSTAVDNADAQKLYESLGYKRDEAFYCYELFLP